MTIDKSLKRKGRLARSRNVLKRAERIDQMKTNENWVEGQSALGLAKTRVVKALVGKKKKKAKEDDEKDGDKKEAPKKDGGKKEAAKK